MEAINEVPVYTLAGVEPESFAHFGVTSNEAEARGYAGALRAGGQWPCAAVVLDEETGQYWVVADERSLTEREEFEGAGEMTDTEGHGGDYKPSGKENPLRRNPVFKVGMKGKNAVEIWTAEDSYDAKVAALKLWGMPFGPLSPKAKSVWVEEVKQGKENPRLQLVGPAGTYRGPQEQSVYLGTTQIGTVIGEEGGHWKAIDMHGRNHGDRYISKWAAADQLRLGLGLKENPNVITHAIAEAYRDVKHAVTKKGKSAQALKRLQEAATPAQQPVKKFGLGKKNPIDRSKLTIASWHPKGKPWNKIYMVQTIFGIDVDGPWNSQRDAQTALDAIARGDREPKVRARTPDGLSPKWPKRNPEDTAEALYEDFHGRPASETVEVTYDEHEHETLTTLGDLCQLKIVTPYGKECIINTAETKSPKDIPDPSQMPKSERIMLCSNEDGTQIYFLGGDQSVDTRELGFKDEDVKDSMFLGVLHQVTYQTQKGFDDFELTNYYHDLGEESGMQPILTYDPISKLLRVSGGQYVIKDVGIVN